MASSTILAILILAIATLCSATDHIVGDDNGWTTDFDYQAWAQGKDFRVGDTLIFNYPAGKHSVVRLSDASSFQECVKTTNGTQQPLTSGNDAITLATPGRKWYICGVSNHCESRNMKLAITVLAQDDVSPSPNSPDTPAQSAANAASVYFGVMAFLFGFMAILHLV